MLENKKLVIAAVVVFILLSITSFYIGYTTAFNKNKGLPND